MKAKVFNISTFTEKYQFAKKIGTYFVRMGGAGVGHPTLKMGDMFSYALTLSMPIYREERTCRLPETTLT